MANTSATGGPLVPNTSPAPLEDTGLVDFLQAWVVGIIGIDPTLVRPRWQPEPPDIPDSSVTWVSIGITSRDSDTFSAVVHRSTGNGYDELRRHEELSILTSFYGPLADTVASQFKDGIQISQNREILALNEMGLISSGTLTAVPELIKKKWLYRVDLPFMIRRRVVRNYPVLNLLNAETNIDNEQYKEYIAAVPGL